MARRAAAAGRSREAVSEAGTTTPCRCRPRARRKDRARDRRSRSRTGCAEHAAAARRAHWDASRSSAPPRGYSLAVEFRVRESHDRRRRPTPPRDAATRWRQRGRRVSIAHRPFVAPTLRHHRRRRAPPERRARSAGSCRPSFIPQRGEGGGVQHHEGGGRKTWRSRAPFGGPTMPCFSIISTILAARL